MVFHFDHLVNILSSILFLAALLRVPPCWPTPLPPCCRAMSGADSVLQILELPIVAAKASSFFKVNFLLQKYLIWYGAKRLYRVTFLTGPTQKVRVWNFFRVLNWSSQHFLSYFSDKFQVGHSHFFWSWNWPPPTCIHIWDSVLGVFSLEKWLSPKLVLWPNSCQVKYSDPAIRGFQTKSKQPK